MKNKFTQLKGGDGKMQETQVKGDKPDFRGTLDLAAWFNTDKNGKTYLSVVVGNRLNLFPVDQEVVQKRIENIFE
ncbi:MAG: hypothetical protein AB1478_06525 [Nitrospirota bacterium]